MWKKEQRNDNIISFIAEGMEIKGNIQCQGSLRLDGIIDGGVDLQGDLTIGTTGMIKGEVKAVNVILAGKLEGNLVVGKKLEITSTGKIKGDIQCSIFTIEEGGTLDGNSRMSGKKADIDTLSAIKGGDKKKN
ncbi:MAG: polymer-forming cytoskeletal protein [Syntrophomonas sp.]|nr:polymer-forming cytoskeletal protein [Syntrophomonas sp.]